MTSSQTHTPRLDDLTARFDTLCQSGDHDAAVALLENATRPVGDDPQSRLLAAHAAVMLARYCMGHARYEAGLAAADRAAELSHGAQPLAAQAELWQALLRETLGQELHAERVAALAEQLVAAGCWDDAYQAHSALALCAGDDIASCRRHTAIAIGCAESAGNYVITTRALQHLAHQEVLHGSPRLALRNIEQALYRAQSVLLNGARLSEAQCLETAGDAHLALKDLEQAAAQYSDAVRRFTRLDQHQRARRVQEKLDSLSGKPT